MASEEQIRGDIKKGPDDWDMWLSLRSNTWTDGVYFTLEDEVTLPETNSGPKFAVGKFRSVIKRLQPIVYNPEQKGIVWEVEGTVQAPAEAFQSGFRFTAAFDVTTRTGPISFFEYRRPMR
jgi:hypothetical protein